MNQELKTFVNTLLHSWGGDSPPESVWAAEDFAKWLATQNNTTYQYDLKEEQPNSDEFLLEIDRILECGKK